ncbi:hypothetical protein ACFPK9_06960 [Rubritalea spongiae]
MTTIQRKCSSFCSQAKVHVCVAAGFLMWMAIVVPATPILQMKRMAARTDVCVKKKH